MKVTVDESLGSNSFDSPIELILIFLQHNKVGMICVFLLLFISSFNLFWETDDAITYLSLIPVNTLIANKYVWNLLTCAFYEKYLIRIVIDIFLIVFATRPLEISSYEQFGIYFILSIIISSFLTSAIAFITFFYTKEPEYIVEPAYGFGGIYVTLLMYIRLKNSKNLLHSKIPFLSYQNLPVVYVTVLLIVEFLHATKKYSMDFTFSLISLIFSWTYLRFFYRFDEASATLGTNNEDFAFMYMFPDALLPIVIPFTTAFYNIGAMWGIFPELEVEKKQTHHLRNQLPNHNSFENNSFQNDAIMERRRAKAMKLLDAKMAEISKDSESWDDKGVDDRDITPSIKINFDSIKV